MQSREFTMLSLGDSYTIGEGVEEADRFPNQAVMQLHLKGIFVEKPKIIATTGWTTDELMKAIQQENLSGTFDFVTLLIGVNNQYRGRDTGNYRKEFEELLKLAISFAGERSKNVVVLSIPDWGVTPFAEGRDRKKIAEEIAEYNEINHEVAVKHGAHYINVTPSTRANPQRVVADGLHPNGEEYAQWAKEVAAILAAEAATK